MHIKKGDIVVVLSGADKGKEGKVLEAFPQENRVVVEGVNVKKKHKRKTSAQAKSQIVDIAMPIFASKVMKKEAKKSTKKK